MAKFSVRTILRGDRPADQGIFANVIPDSIWRLQFLPDDLDEIKKSIEKEWPTKDKNGDALSDDEQKKEWSKAIGWFMGYVVEIGAALRIPFFTSRFGFDLRSHRWNKKSKTATRMNDILTIQAAGCGSGEIDVLFTDELNKVAFCFSCKLRHIYEGKISWGETEVDRLVVIEGREAAKQFGQWRASRFAK